MATFRVTYYLDQVAHADKSGAPETEDITADSFGERPMGLVRFEEASKVKVKLAMHMVRKIELIGAPAGGTNTFRISYALAKLQSGVPTEITEDVQADSTGDEIGGWLDFTTSGTRKLWVNLERVRRVERIA